MPRTPRIAIIGGGIGGLAAALALERRGAETIVYEQSSELSEIGAGLNLTPNAVKALRALGIEMRARRLIAGAHAAQADAIRGALRRLTDPAAMGSHFKVLALTHPAAPPPDGFSAP